MIETKTLELDPLRTAQREWEKADRELTTRFEAYRATRHVSDAVMLAAAYEEERTLYAIFEELVIEAYRVAS